MHKKFLLASGLLLSATGTFAQTKIGNTPATINANSILELESTNKGLLLPRVLLTGTANVAPLAAHVQGMAVYNTATAGNVTPGFYYNDGAKWIRLALTGSAGKSVDTTADAWVDNPTNTRVELGTTSNNVVRTAGTEFVVKDNGNVGIGTNAPNTNLEINAAATNTSGLRFTNLTSASPVTFAPARILGVNATGDVVVAPVGNGGPGFASTVSSAKVFVANATTKLTYQSEDFDNNNDFTPSTGQFIVSVAGRYIVSANQYVDPQQIAGFAFIRIYKNGNLVIQGTGAQKPVGQGLSTSVSAVMKLVVGDIIDVRISVGNQAESALVGAGDFSVNILN